MAYSWNPLEVMDLLGIRIDSRKTEAMIVCPFCNSKRFGFNTVKGIGQCWSCQQAADSARYYATVMGMSLNEARKDIEARLGIENKFGKVVRTLPPRVVYNTKKEEVTRIDDKELDRTYRAFLSELTLSEKNRAMLQSRGFSDNEIEALMYKTFPNRSNVDFLAICERLLKAGCKLEGVPGFYKQKDGRYTFIQLTQGIIMPQKNHRDQICGLQIRKDDDLRCYIEETGDLEKKCAWFTSKNRDGGCPATARIHYACDWTYDTHKGIWKPLFPDGGFVLTEGIMKADLTHFLQPNLPVISVPGVNALNYLEQELRKLKEYGVTTILSCYDMDYKTNPNVQTALEKTKNMIEEIGLRYKRLDWETEITINGKPTSVLKGIDDYLAYCALGIIPEIKKI